MDGKTLARVGAIIFVSVAITATAIEMTRKEERPAVRPTPVLEQAADPLREGLGREQGQSIGDPLRLIVPMLERFIATDRGFARARREGGQRAARADAQDG